MQQSQKYQHFAFDVNNNIIDIHNTDKVCEQLYFCPHCHNEMIAKRGNIRQWHFAHKTDKCSYDNYLHSIAEKMIMAMPGCTKYIKAGIQSELKWMLLRNISFLYDLSTASILLRTYSILSSDAALKRERRRMTFSMLKRCKAPLKRLIVMNIMFLKMTVLNTIAK